MKDLVEMTRGGGGELGEIADIENRLDLTGVRYREVPPHFTYLLKSTEKQPLHLARFGG